ncbi:MAG: hypothetical protein ACRCSF_06060 [Mycobacteriaceae bacterium]
MKKKSIIIAGAVSAFVVVIAAAVLWFWIESLEPVTGVSHEPSISDLDFTGKKLVEYLNESEVNLEGRTSPTATNREASQRLFHLAEPREGCKYGYTSSELISMESPKARGESLEIEGKIAVAQSTLDYFCNNAKTGTVEIEYGVITDMSEWSALTSIYRVTYR